MRTVDSFKLVMGSNKVKVPITYSLIGVIFNGEEAFALAEVDTGETEMTEASLLMTKVGDELPETSSLEKLGWGMVGEEKVVVWEVL